MNTEIIRKAYQQDLLKEYDLASAKVGDKVLGLKPGEVLTIYGDTIVFGWQCGEVRSVNSYRQGTSVGIYLAPLCWVEEKPVYEGDTLYKENGKPVMARKLTSNGELLLFSRGGSWRIDGSDSKLTWEPPQEDVFEVEGKPLKVGDTLFTKTGDEVTVEAFEHGTVVTTPGTKYGCTYWTTDFLSWTDPTILGEVEGKPVRKGDVLYGKWWGSADSGYVVDGIDKGHLTSGGVALPWRLSWTKVIYIGGHWVPVPELDAPEKGKLYYVPSFIAEPLCYRWDNDKFDLQMLAKGLVHLTEENAEAHAKALVAFTSK